MATFWTTLAGTGHVAWCAVTWTQPAPTVMVEPVSVTTVCVGDARSLRSTWLVSPGPALKRKVPPRSTASVDADADPATASVPAMARTESAAVERMERPP